MTIKLDTATEQLMILSIAEGIGTTEFPEGKTLGMDYLRWVSPLQQHLPQEAQAKIARFVDEKGLIWFVYKEIMADIVSYYGMQNLPKGMPLTSVAGFHDTISAAKRLVARLREVPARYRVTMALPSNFSDPIMDSLTLPISLGKNTIITNGGSLPSPFPLKSKNEHIDARLFRGNDADEASRDLSQSRLYFSHVLLGHATIYGSGQVFRDFEDALKAFCGAALAVGFTDYDWRASPEAASLMLHKETEDRPILTTESPEEDVAEGKRWLSTRDFVDHHAGYARDAVKSTFRKISTVFGEDEHARKMFTACMWFYRATVNQRPLDRLLEATISIEVMLGDRKESEGIGLTNLLGNRSAYLLGHSPANRREIIDQFAKVYGLRSAVVHAGKHKVEGDDRKTVMLAVALAGRIIAREMAIAADVGF